MHRPIDLTMQFYRFMKTYKYKFITLPIMPLVVDMPDLDKDEFIVRARRKNTTASAVVRELIKKWMSEHPEYTKTRQKPSIE